MLYQRMDPSRTTSSDEGSPLTSLPSDLTAYEQLVSDVGERIATYKPRDPNDRTVAILEAFSKYLPREGRDNFYEDILGCNAQEELKSLGDHLYTAILLPMKAHGKTPAPTPSPQFGAETRVEEIAGDIAASSRNQQRWLKKACLARDGNRCMLTGVYDGLESLKLPATELSDLKIGDTELVHIIPFALAMFGPNEVQQASIIWDAIYRYFPSLLSRLNFSTDNINDTCNAMTLNSGLHAPFGRFSFALEPTSHGNEYLLRRYRRFPTFFDPLLPDNGIMKFTAHHPSHRLPHPTLLETHASIAKILHMSGMGEYIENLLRERELIGCLANDGSTDIKALLMVY
ncbi:hypothetical protein BDZ91DRAFT_783580 [Kalaharituber pfeilii]|nr:hypothetical protein BDZ91DRAFT_783580 [Kalaharituber pfeilii]